MSEASTISAAGPMPAHPSMTTARLAGWLYLALLPTAGLGVFGAQAVLEHGDQAVAAQVAAQAAFLKAGVLAGGASAVVWLALAVVLVALFQRVSARLCQVLAVFVVAGATLMLAALARRLDAVTLVATAPSLGAGASQWHALAAFTLHSSEHLMQTSLIFSGFWVLPLGLLVYRSGFLPKTLGVLLIMGAPFYIASYAGAVWDPDFARTPLAMVIGYASGVPGTIGELATALWLVVRGTSASR